MDYSEKKDKKERFSTPPILINFFAKFYGLVLGCIGSIDHKLIDSVLAQPI